MNDKQNSELNMFQAVNDVLKANKSKYESIPLINAAADELEAKIALIRETDQGRSEIIVPAVSSEKYETEDTMINEAVILGRVLNVYAKINDDRPLQMLTDVSKSQFYRLHDNDELVLAKSILAKTKENAEALKDYGVTAEQISVLETATTKFEEFIAKPRTTISSRKEQTYQLKQLFAETKSLLYDRLDKLMGVLKTSEAAFYNAYFSARNIINTSSRKNGNQEPQAAK